MPVAEAKPENISVRLFVRHLFLMILPLHGFMHLNTAGLIIWEKKWGKKWPAVFAVIPK